MAQVFHEPIGSVPTLHLSYHLGEHYNSVRRGDDTEEKDKTPIKDFPIGHDLEKLQDLLKDKELHLNLDVDDDEAANPDDEPKDEVVEYAIVKLGAKQSDKKIMKKCLKEIFKDKLYKMSRLDQD